MSLLVQITPEAGRQIREIDDWWRANRLAVPDLFLNEVTEAIDVLASVPLIGRRYLQSSVLGTRRMLLSGTRYHVYYVPLGDQVVILAVWHAQRGVGPPLRAR